MNWLIFFIGILVGWLIELIIDFVFWRKRYQGSASEARLRIELAGLEAKSSQLESQLVGCKEIRENYAARTAELQACREALHQSEELIETDSEDVQEAHVEVEPEVQAPGEREPEAESVEVNSEVAERTAPVIEVAGIVPDDLRKIEGVGPKIASILNDNDILTFAQLAETEVARLQEILEAAGSRYALADPATWPEQAALAATGDWDAFKVFLDQLKGGRREPQ